MSSKFLDLNDIDPDGLQLDRPLDPAEFPGGELEDCRVEGGKLIARVQPGPKGVEFDARLEARVQHSCVRCLEPFDSRLGFDFHLTLVGDGAELGGGELKVDEDDPSELFYAKGGRVDLGAVAAEQIYLNLPLKPICREDCRGLCPTCGANRNRLECGCSEHRVDPRLAPLLDWSKSRRDS